MAHEIVLIYEARIATVQILEQIFSRLADAGIRYRGRAVREVRTEDFTPESFPIFVRTDGYEAYRLAHAMRKLGIKYGYYLDDNFWELDPAIPVGEYYARRQVRRRLGSIIGGASTILVSTPALKEYLAAFEPRVHVAESFFDFSLIPDLPPSPPDRRVRRGGFASSEQRISDVVPMFDELISTLDARPDLEFEVIGAAPAGVRDHPRITWLPYLPSYEAYIEFQMERQWDFAIAPLAAVESNLYKTDNKYREYAAQGIPGIYQDLRPYASVRDGETGLLVGPGRRSWREAIEQYLDDPGLRADVRIKARADAERRLSINAVAGGWLAQLRPAPVAGPKVTRLRRTLARNRRRVPAWLLGPRSLVQAATVSLRQDGAVETMRRTADYMWRRARGVTVATPGERRSADRLEQ